MVAHDLDGQSVGARTDPGRILLKADQGPAGAAWSDAQSQPALAISAAPLARVRKSCAQRGVQEAILSAKASAMRRRPLDGRGQAYLIALVCSAPPDGLARWTLRGLANKLVQLGYIAAVNPATHPHTPLPHLAVFFTDLLIGSGILALVVSVVGVILLRRAREEMLGEASLAASPVVAQTKRSGSQEPGTGVV